MSLFDRAKNILFTPKTEWEVIKSETATVADLFTKYAVILAALPAIAGFIGYSIFGISYGFGSIRVPVGSGIMWAILTYILNLGGVFIFAFIIDALAPSFGSTKDLIASTKVVVYAYTASWVVGILQIFPVLSPLVLIGSIYTLVLLYMGLQRIKDVPQDKMVGYFVVSIIIAVVIYFVIGAIVTSVAFGGLLVSGLSGI